MKCRCGHGRTIHYPTRKGRAGYAERRRSGLGQQRISQPCHQWERSTSDAFPPCRCRDWKPQEVRPDR